MSGRVPWEPPHVEPIDPDSEEGKRVAREMGELIADVEDRLAREAAEAEVRGDQPDGDRS